MTREELVAQGLSEALADQIVALEKRADAQDAKVSDLSNSVTTLTEANTRLESANTKLEESNTKLRSDLDTHQTALETSEAARLQMEQTTAQKEAEDEAKSYAPLTISADACMAIAKLDDESAKVVRDALVAARDEINVLQGELGTPTGDAPEGVTGNASKLTDYVQEKMAQGMTRAEALATPEAQSLASEERAAIVRRAARERD